MLSAAQQRGRLRQLILQDLKTADLKAVFKGLLKDNDQNVTGFLQRSVSSSKYTSSLRVSSRFDKSSGFITDVLVRIDAPWGRYGKELDSAGGRGAVQDAPNTETILQWINAKGVTATITVNKTLKDGSKKEYIYSDTRSARKAMAYNIAKRINETKTIKTRNPYSDDIARAFAATVNISISKWFDEMGADFVGDVYGEIANLI